MLDSSLPPANHELAVYFDGGCPVCSREIRYYRRLDRDGKIQWEDVAADNPSCPIGYDRQTLLQRFHVKDLVTGEIHHGAAGFARLWCALAPPWRWIGRVALLPPVTWTLEIGYRITLRLRPWLTRRRMVSP